MPSLASHHSNTLVKLLAMGMPKTGKTGSLVSLVAAGYRLRILDFDNLLDILAQLVARDCPQFLDNVEYRSLRDQRKNVNGKWDIVGTPKAFSEGVKMLDRWKYEDVDLGPPADWGPDCVLVIDTLSRMSDAAIAFAETLVQRGRDGQFDGRALVGEAQRLIEKILSGLTSEHFRTNVIVFAHVDLYELSDGTKRGFPKAPGQKLSPNVPSYFPNVVLYESVNNKRSIRTTSTSLVELANAKPFVVNQSFPIETGLAEIFRAFQSPPGATPREPAPAPQPAPTVLNLTRK